VNFILLLVALNFRDSRREAQHIGPTVELLPSHSDWNRHDPSTHKPSSTDMRSIYVAQHAGENANRGVEVRPCGRQATSRCIQTDFRYYAQISVPEKRATFTGKLKPNRGVSIGVTAVSFSY
jgi:hypothetical protein